jgi:hypothetical protein
MHDLEFLHGVCLEKKFPVSSPSMSELPVSYFLSKDVNKNLLRSVSAGVENESFFVLIEGLSLGSSLRVSEGVLSNDGPLGFEIVSYKTCGMYDCKKPLRPNPEHESREVEGVMCS